MLPTRRISLSRERPSDQKEALLIKRQFSVAHFKGRRRKGKEPFAFARYAPARAVYRCQRKKPPLRGLEIRIQASSSYHMWRFIFGARRDGFAVGMAYFGQGGGISRNRSVYVAKRDGGGPERRQPLALSAYVVNAQPRVTAGPPVCVRAPRAVGCGLYGLARGRPFNTRSGDT